MSVAVPDQPSDDDLLQDVLAIINELAKKSAGGDYLYRGEPECYPKVSSGLYRKFSSIAGMRLDIEIVQREMVQTAKRFSAQTEEDDDEILDQLQHYGCSTNLIDFTTDYHIALFFACNGYPEQDGRVILLSDGAYPSRKPRVPVNRVIAQKSVFVQPPRGFVEPSEIVTIPHQLKDRILEHLDHAHGVSDATVYNDLHGFIRYYRTHERAYTAFYTALTHGQKGQHEAAIEYYSKSIKLDPRQPATYNNRGIVYERTGDFDLGIQDYNKALALNPQYSPAYHNRGIVYYRKGDYDRAFRDYDRAIDLDPKIAGTYYNRAESRLILQDWEKAESDLSIAQSLGVDIVSEFCNEFGSVPAFERKHNVKLPASIAELLKCPKQE